jgi:hypothetical protein
MPQDRGLGVIVTEQRIAAALADGTLASPCLWEGSSFLPQIYGHRLCL